MRVLYAGTYALAWPHLSARLATRPAAIHCLIFMVTNYNALGVHSRAKPMAMNMRVNSQDKVKSVGKIAGARAQKNGALLIADPAPKLNGIDFARSGHA